MAVSASCGGDGAAAGFRHSPGLDEGKAEPFLEGNLMTRIDACSEAEPDAVRTFGRFFGKL